MVRKVIIKWFADFRVSNIDDRRRLNGVSVRRKHFNAEKKNKLIDERKLANSIIDMYRSLKSFCIFTFVIEEISWKFTIACFVL